MVAKEPGAGNENASKFATIISIGTSLFIDLLVSLILGVAVKIALMYPSSSLVLEAVQPFFILLAFNGLLNNIHPVLSGMAIGSGW